MPSTPDFNLLPIFVAVAETSSMSEAARRLGIPKSSVSRGVAALEESLGVQLFHRTTRQVSLTTAGSAFFEKAVPLVTAFKELAASLEEQEEEPSGVLRITAAVDLGLTFFVEAASKFAARYPQISLDVRLSNALVDLTAEGFDAALRISAKLADSSLVARKLTQLEAGLYASPTYLARRRSPRTLEDATEHDWVLHGSFRDLPGMPELPAKPRMRTDDLMFARGMVREGVGIGLLPTFIAQRDVTEGRLVRLLPKWSVKAGNLYFVYPPSQHVPRKVTALRDFLIEYLAARPLCESHDPQSGVEG